MLITEQDNVYEQIKQHIQPEDVKTELEHRIVEKIYTEFEKQNKPEDILSLFSEEDEISKITEIMAENYEFTDIDKGVKDLIKTYSLEKLTNRRNEVIEKLKDTNLDKELAKELEKELSTIIVELAKIK